MSVPCLRCGDFLSEENRIVLELDLCAACLDAGIEPETRVALPRVIVFARFKWILVMLLCMAVAGTLGALVGGAALAFPLVILAEFGSIAALGSQIGHAGLAAWKREVRTKLSLPDTPALRFVIYFPRKPHLWHLAVPFDGAFVGEGKDGLVILGERVRRFIPLASVTRASVERVFFNPPRSAVRLDLPNGPCFFAFLEKTTFRANRELARECVARLSR